MDNLIYIFILIFFGPSVLFVIVGLIVSGRSKKAGLTCYILAALYPLIAWGTCGLLLN